MNKIKQTGLPLKKMDAVVPVKKQTSPMDDPAVTQSGAEIERLQNKISRITLCAFLLLVVWLSVILVIIAL